jgi:hypothetical protein
MRALTLGLLVWVQFILVTVNYRAIAQARYIATGVTDFLIAGLGFTLFKLIQEATSPMEVLGYSIGAVLGGISGIWLTKHWRAE